MRIIFPRPGKLADALGAPMPKTWARFMKIAHTHARTRPDMACYFEDTLTLRFSGRCLRAWGAKADPADGHNYTQTPPEFIELGNMGVDGVTYGMVIRTPECPEVDPPIAEFSPMDSDPICLLGKNAMEAIENLVAQGISFREDDKVDEAAADTKKFTLQMRQIEKALGFKPSKKHAERQYDKNGDARPIPVKARKGYRYMDSADGIGVHAPVEAFARSNSTPRLTEKTPINSLLKHASSSLKAGFPASALVIAKSGWWWHSHDQRASRALGAILRDAYQSLNRPTYAAIALQQVEHSLKSAATLRALGY